MSGVAQVLVAHGMRVTGAERGTSPAVERLRRLGVRVDAGEALGPCPKGAQCLVVTPETEPLHRHRLSAARRGLAQSSPAEWLGRFMRRNLGLAVVGQRDAGVASAMIGWTLVRAGLDPTVVVGTPVSQLGGWARVGGGPHFVVEAIEEAGEFGPCGPRVAVLLNVLAPKGDDPAVRSAAIRRFAASVPPGGLVLAMATNDLVAAAVRDLRPETEWISLERGGTWWAADLREDRGRYRFRAFHRGRFVVEVRLQVPGRRNVLCALAAVAACDRLEVPPSEIKHGLEEFAGVSRDFESRGSYRGVTLVDDDGGDPSAISESLAVARQMFGTRRLWAVFRPDASGWAPEDAGKFAAAFAAADRVILMEGEREREEEGAETGRGGADALARDLDTAGVLACRVGSVEGAIRDLDRQLEPGDVLVTLGAGEVGTIADAFIRRLPRDRQGR